MEHGQALFPLYERPHGKIGRIISRCLGPLPSYGVADLSLIDTRFDWRMVPRYPRIACVCLAAAVLGIVSPMLWMLEWPRYSIISGVVALTGMPEIAQGIVLGVCGGLYMLMLFRFIDKHESQGGWKGFLGPAISEELWFRTGAEAWSWRQRAVSCVMFGLIHILNLLVPLRVGLALSLPGAVFIWIYLREYRRTGSVELATYTSGLFHAKYNETLIYVIIPTVALGMLGYICLHFFGIV